MASLHHMTIRWRAATLCMACLLHVTAGTRTAMVRGRHKAPKPGSVEQSLLQNILSGYDTDARGVIDPNDSVNVNISFLLLRIQALNERSQVLTTTGLIICDWIDERLKWDPAKYYNISDIVIRPDRIWLPELAVMNGAEDLSPDFTRIRALLSHDGRVHWEPGTIFTTTCDIDIRYFPFDEQICPIQIGAWAYYAARMNISSTDTEIQTKGFRVNGEWEIFNTQVINNIINLPCCPDINYPYVEFNLHLRRRYTFYMMNIILPCSLLSILVMIVFCLPPDAGEKISLGISVLLAFTVFLLMVAENVPRTSLHIPVMVLYLTATSLVSTASVMLSVLVLNVHHRDAELPVPTWLRILCIKYIARVLCISGRKPKTFANIEKRMDFESKLHSKKGTARKLAQFTPMIASVIVPNGKLRQVKEEDEEDEEYIGKDYTRSSSRKPLYHRNGCGPHNTGVAKASGRANTGHSHLYSQKKASSVNSRAHIHSTYYNSNGCSNGGGSIRYTAGSHRHPGPDRHMAESWDSLVTRAGQRRNWSYSYEWREIAHILDRFFFVVVFIFSLITFFMFLLTPFYKTPYTYS